MTGPFIAPIDTGVALPDDAIISGRGCPRCGADRDTVLAQIRLSTSPITEVLTTCAECLMDMVVGAEHMQVPLQVFIERKGPDGKVVMQLVESSEVAAAPT